ncbi:MAG: hypothetical protein AB8F65_01430 [Woeseiaceae bacterium]
MAIVLLPATLSAYEPDAALRKSLAKAFKKELVAATPQAQRFSVRVSFSTKGAFRDYERLAKKAGFPAYDDCSIATFAEVTNWQILQGNDIEPERIKTLVKLCEASPTTVLGPKPLPQIQGDREILRGMWQRNLAFVGRTLRDEALAQFVREDARNQFFLLHGEPADWRLTANGFKPTEQPPETALPDAADPTDIAVASPRSTEAPRVIPADETENDFQLIMRTVTRYGLSGVYVKNETYLLLNDGSIKRRLTKSPHTLDVVTSKRQQSDDWGRWKKSGDQIEVRWPGDEAVIWKKWFITRPATRPSLRGRFQSADGFGGGRVANFNTVAFDKDGRFSWATLKGGDTGAWLPAYSDRERAGTYELDQFSIHLRYNDGTIETYAFCFYPKDNQHLVIGSNHFRQLD